jgi:SAM-dependent methyltransferase
MKYLNLLECPDCRTGSLILSGSTLVCIHCGNIFQTNDRRPILFEAKNDVFPKQHYVSIPRSVEKPKRLSALVPNPSTNIAYQDNLIRLMEHVLRTNKDSVPSVLVVGCGNQRIWLDKLLKQAGSIDVVYCDVDVHADTDIFCDAHTLPFKSNSFNAVINTAVLEHVMYPGRVASEMARLVKVNGFIYSEVPFMQQVHEGAYDFTRFTLSGHRLLFPQFQEIDSGLVAGPATALVWAIENFIVCFGGSNRTRLALRAISRLCFFWVKYFDYLLRYKEAALDGASCTFFFGQKTENFLLSPQDAINYYRGARAHYHL